MTGDGRPGADPAALDPALAEIWRGVREEVSAQVAAVEDAVAALLAGTLDDAERERGRGEAHKLAGSVATFGFARAGASARELELAFAGPLALDDAPRLAQLALELRRDLLSGAGAADRDAADQATAAPSRPRLLLDALPPARADAVRRAAAARGWTTVERTASASVARERAADAVPLSTAGDAAAQPVPVPAASAAEEGAADAGGAAAARPVPLALVGDAGAETAARVAALSGRAGGAPHAGAIAVALASDGAADRVELLDAGAARFLPADLPPERLLDELADLEEGRRRERAKIVALDDDRAILALLDATLGAAGHELIACADPQQLWAALAASAPDLVILDVELPGSTGVQLCRALRADDRLRALPVLFLTGTTDPATVAELFAAGADDYVAKPVLGPELLARVEARLERSRLRRRLAEVDELTGLARREHAAALLQHQLATARRLTQPLAVALLTVDGLAALNERHGAAAGDAALRAAGTAIAAVCGPEEVAARWAGGQLLVAMLGLDEHGARGRVGDLLEAARAHAVAGGERLTLSAGVALHPRGGDSAEQLTAAAHAARRRAAGEGGDRVAVAGADGAADGERVDVALVEDDPALAPLILHALTTRGYRSRWIDDGDEAARLLGSARPQLAAGLVLLDWDLPGRDGLTLLRGLAEDGALARTRVVMLTARATQHEVLAALELGADDHVAKPFGVPVLMQKVRSQLRR